MRGTIIGSDYIFDGTDAKVLEINTNTGIFNQGLQYIDINPFFDFLEANNITTLEFIYNETITPPTGVFNNGFNGLLASECDTRSITYVQHEVQSSAITIPSVTDADDKFILRHAYDVSAIVDSTYCADKLEFLELMSGSDALPKTYASSSDFLYDTLDTIDTSVTDAPNLIEKARYPNYDLALYPKLYGFTDSGDLASKKADITSDSFFIQEYIKDDNNIVDDRITVIRSLDIIHGANLDIIHLGSYRNSSVLPLSHDSSTFRLNLGADGLESSSLSSYTRFKYLNKYSGKQTIQYHTDAESDILIPNNLTTNIENLEISSSVVAPRFQLVTGSEYSGEPNDEYQEHNGTLELTTSSISYETSSVTSIVSESVEDLFVRVTLNDGTSFDDAPENEIYTVISGSNEITRFEFVNKLLVGDKIVYFESGSSNHVAKEITSLDIVYKDNFYIYNVDIEPYDYFLVDSKNGDGLFSIHHNACNYCYTTWAPCGNYWCDNNCSTCYGGCFIAGTKVTLSDGSQMNIEDIEPGQLVKTFDTDENIVSEGFVGDIVELQQDKLVKITLSNDHVITTTPEHPFYVSNREEEGFWTVAEDIAIDDDLLKLDGSSISVTTIETIEESATVYNLVAVSDFNNFFVDGILVHNKK